MRLFIVLLSFSFFLESMGAFAQLVDYTHPFAANGSMNPMNPYGDHFNAGATSGSKVEEAAKGFDHALSEMSPLHIDLNETYSLVAQTLEINHYEDPFPLSHFKAADPHFVFTVKICKKETNHCSPAITSSEFDASQVNNAKIEFNSPRTRLGTLWFFAGLLDDLGYTQSKLQDFNIRISVFQSNSVIKNHLVAKSEIDFETFLQQLKNQSLQMKLLDEKTGFSLNLRSIASS